MKKSYYKAFSLMELSVVIIIIGIFVAGIAVATSLIDKSRLAKAESLSRSSPIPGITNNVLWLETSLGGSIASSEANNGSSLTAWYDQSLLTNKPSVVAVGAGPTYANTINSVHAVKFSGSASNYLQVSDASFLNNTDYTIFVLEKRQGSGGNNYFIGTTSANANDSLALGYSADSTVIHAQGSSSYSSTVSSYNSSVDNARQFIFIHSATAGNKTYINGVLAAEDVTKTAHLSGITSLAIGKGYTGEIGEIAIFTKALGVSERQSVEDYAGNKWSRKVNRNAVSGGSCVGYTVTDTGCDLSAANCSINITGLVATVAPVSSSTSIACNQASYFGSVTYTCINGTANVTGSCSTGSPCSGVSITGVSSAVSASSGSSGTVTCDVAGYSGTASYSCSNGTLSTTASCGCASGYGLLAGTCQLNCTSGFPAGIASSNSFSPTSTSTAATCDVAGYSGSINYTCSGGVFSVVGGSTCSMQPCTGGTITSAGGRTIHTFTTASSPKTLTCSPARTASVLVVGGGGSGGCAASAGGGGGGGGGGVVYAASYSLGTSPYNITVGSGGASVNSSSGSLGNSGGPSIFGTLTALGGGGGGYFSSAGSTINGSAGGSSGGAGGGVTTLSGVASSQTAQSGETNHYGNSGGGASGNNSGYCGGGGGGAGGAGGQSSPGNNGVGGAGGAAISNSITGSSVYYGAGGGGSNGNGGVGPGTGGSGVGGDGGNGKAPATVGSAGAFSATGTAGNGGGGSRSVASGAGSDGIVIISY